MTHPIDPAPLLASAIADLGAGRYEAVIAALDGLPGGGGPVGRGLALVARGHVLEAEERRDEALRRFEQAFALGPALPAVALRALEAAFRRAQRALLAHHAFLMLDLVEPNTLDEAILALPTADRARYAMWAMRSSWWAQHGDLYGLARFKGALADRLGAEAAALLLADVPGPHGPRRAVRRRLTRLIDQARESGIDYEELIAAGPARSDPVRAWGGPDGPVEERITRALFTCVLSDVVVSARSGILLTGDRALIDVQGDELVRRPQDLTVDPVVAVGAREDPLAVILTEPTDRASLPSLDEAIWLGGVHSVAWGHWIMEYLPKAWALMHRDGFTRVPLLVDARMPEQHLEAVRLLTGRADPVIVLEDRASVRVERLWTASALAHLPVGPLPTASVRRAHNGVDDEALGHLMARISPVLSKIDAELEDRTVSKRLFLARKSSQHRRLENAAAIEGVLADRGFVSVDLAELPFIEQLRLVRGADWVVGADGSALLTCIFGRPGLRIGALIPPGASDIGWLNEVSRGRGFELRALYGAVSRPHERYRSMSDYEIDEALLVSYLAESGHEPPERPYVRGTA